MEDRCVCCNEIIPEGTQVCYKCLYNALQLKLPNDTLHPSPIQEKEWQEIIQSIKHKRKRS